MLQINRLRTVNIKERQYTAQAIKLIAHIDAANEYVPLGYDSLSRFLIKDLGYCEGTAFRRIQVARLIQKFPIIMELIENGDLHITGASLLCPILTEKNHIELLRRAQGRSRREIEAIIADYTPVSKTKPVDRINRIAMTREVSEPCASPTPASTFALVPEKAKLGTCNADSNQPSPKKVREQMMTVNFCAGEGLIRKIDRVKSLISHKVPHADLEAIITEVMDAYLLKNDPLLRKNRSQQPTANPRSRYIPKAILKKVHEQAGGACSFVSADGRRCSGTKFLQVDHIVPFSKGGKTELENLQLLCGKHNRYKGDDIHG